MTMRSAQRGAAVLAMFTFGIVGCDASRTTTPQLRAPSAVSHTSVAPSSTPKIRAGVDQVCEFYPNASTIQCQKMWNFGLGQYGGNNFGQYVASYTDANIVNIVTGPFSVCVLLNTGNTKCWGENASDIEYTGGDATSVSLSRGSACVVTQSGTVKCRSAVNAFGIYHSTLDTWTVEYGQSGVDPTKANPIPWTGKAKWIVSGGQFHCFQTDANPNPSTLSCLGSSYSHQSGAEDENQFARYTFNGTPAPVSSSSSYNICVMMQEGNVDCLPIYYNDNGYVSGPKNAGSVGATDLSGQGSTCALITGDNIECWGSAFHYEYAVGYSNHYTVSGRNAVAIARSGGDLCWLDNVGSVSCMATRPNEVLATAPASTVRDVTPPVIVPTVSGTLGANSWYTSDVIVSWSVTDAESQATSSGCGAVTVTNDTNDATFTCSATSEGGSSSRSVTVRRDATKPVIGYAGNAGSYAVDQTVAITCSASDGMSGLNLAATSCANIGGAAYSFSVGSNSFSAGAADNAGNTSAATTNFTVVVTSGGLCALVNRWVSNAGVANSFCVKLDHQSYGAFRNELSAQSGKKISAENAATLLRLVNTLG